MAIGQVQDAIAIELASQYDRPIAVSVISKASKFPFLQELGFHGQLGYAKEMFHGLQDFTEQMTRYSSTSATILLPAWNTISQTAPLNPRVAGNLFVSAALGKVGRLFKSLIGFSQVFAASPEELKDPATTQAKTAAALS